MEKWKAYLRSQYLKAKENGSYYKRKSVIPKWRRIYRRKTRYGLSHAEFLFLLNKQQKRCAICRKLLKGKYNVDHDHEARYVRGLLCRSCNQGLGLFRDNVGYLKSASLYLEESVDLLIRQAKKLREVV